MQPIHRFTLALCAGLLSLVGPALTHAASPAQNQPATTQPAGQALTPQLRELLSQLDDNDYMTRDLAMTTLLADATLTDEMIDKLYAASTSEEQRVRLQQVAVHHTARRLSMQYQRPHDSAVLGMSPAAQDNLGDDNDNTPAVVVRWTFPGSVAFAYLRQGDVITLVDGKPIQTTGQDGQVTLAFIQLIANHKSGDPISFHVIRDGHQLDISLKLGSGAALQGIYQNARTSQSRQFNAFVDKQVKDRLAALDQLVATSAPATLTLTLPAITESPEKQDQDAAGDKPDEDAAVQQLQMQLEILRNNMIQN